METVCRNGKDFDLHFFPRFLVFEKCNPGQSPSFEPATSERIGSSKGCGSAPSRLRVEITWTCNASCSYCIVFGNLAAPEGAMTIETARRILADFEKERDFDNEPVLIILGGEPLTNVETLVYLLENFSGKSYVVTNGTLVTRELAHRFSGAGATFYVSLDGPDAERNKARMFANGTPLYEKAVRGYETLRAAGVPTGIMMVASPDTVCGGADMVIETARKFKPVEIGYSLPHWSKTEKAATSPAAYGRALADLLRRRDELVCPVMQLTWRLVPIFSRTPRMAACPLATDQVTFLPGGKAVRCAKIDLDETLSSVTSDSIRSAAPLLQEGKNCGACIGLGVCGGGCPFDGLRRFGELRDLRECDVIPQLLEAIFDLVMENAPKLPYSVIPAEAMFKMAGDKLVSAT